jgi:hypothetical protein
MKISAEKISGLGALPSGVPNSFGKLNGHSGIKAGTGL